MWKIALMGIVNNLGLLLLLNNRGEAGAEDKGKGAEGAGKQFSEEQVNAIVQDRLAREKSKYSDYDELKKFRADHEKEKEALTQKELEQRKEYDKLKDSWLNKEREYQGIISKKDSEITDMKIGSVLMSEIVKQNAYAEETMALIKSQAVIKEDGKVFIKGRDKNGLEVLDSVEEGISKFLTQRPHLVRVTKKDGGGTPPAGGGAGGGNSGGEDLNSLNAEMLQAINKGDHKRAKELKTKISALVGNRRL